MSEGVHSLLDCPGMVMTDSGTFQSYVYGDVEVGVEEIRQFSEGHWRRCRNDARRIYTPRHDLFTG